MFLGSPLIAITILANKVFQPMTQIPGLFVQWAKAKVAVEDLETNKKTK